MSDFINLDFESRSEIDLKKYGLDVPQVTLLAYELKKSGVDVPDGILTTEELVSALCQSN